MRIRTKTNKKKDFKLELEPHIVREIGAVVYLGLAIIFYLFIRAAQQNTSLQRLFASPEP